MNLLAIDPGADTGWALFVGSTLREAGLCKPDGPSPFWDVIGIPDPDLIVLELPQVYGPRQSKGPAGDLVTLAYRAGLVVGMARAEWGDNIPVEAVTPFEWKRNLPKEATEARARKALREEEMGCTCLEDVAPSKQHNVWDAIALGLWRLKRFR